MIFNLETDEENDWLESTQMHRRRFSEEDIQRYESFAAEFFTALGMDLNTPATMDTPRRFIHALIDITDGYDGDPNLVKVFDTECHGGTDCHLSQVVEGPIHFFSLCEHHALPVIGQAYVGYIAHEQIIGLSKLTRLVRLYAKRFTVQERLGRDIADNLDRMLHPHGVAVYLEAHHMCMSMRGVREIPPLTRTTFWRGNYNADASLRAEFFTVSGLQH